MAQTKIPETFCIKGVIAGKVYPDDSPPYLFYSTAEIAGYATFAQVDVTIQIPTVADPKVEQVKAIKKAIEKERGESQNRITEMQAEINSLLAIGMDEERL